MLISIITIFQTKMPCTACSAPDGKPRLGCVEQPSKGQPLLPGHVGSLSTYPSLLIDLDEPLGLALVEHHASDGGDQALVGQVERAVGVWGPCAAREGAGPQPQMPATKPVTPGAEGPVRAERPVQLPRGLRALSEH